jgi:hypothetical protein
MHQPRVTALLIVLLVDFTADSIAQLRVDIRGRALILGR